jgi:hypothetical protein
MKTFVISEYDTDILDNLHLGQPYSLAGGSYFSNLYYDNGEKQALCIRTPHATVKTNKKKYIDLLFNNDIDSEYQSFLERFEENVKSSIMGKMEEWFESSFDEETLDYLMQPVTRDFRKLHFISRIYVENSENGLQIYDSNQKHLLINDISERDDIVTLLLCKGIKITSQSITLVLLAKQILLNKGERLEQFALCENTKVEESPKIQINTTNKSSKVDEAPTLETGIDSSDSEDETNSSIPFVERNSEKDSKEIKEHSHLENNNFSSEPLEEVEQIVAPTLVDYGENITNEAKEYISGLEEVELQPTTDVTVTLQEPYEVFEKLYKSALLRAKQAKKEAILAYLKVHEVKNQYMIDDNDDHELSEDEEDLDNLSVMSCDELHNLQ